MNRTLYFSLLNAIVYALFCMSCGHKEDTATTADNITLDIGLDKLEEVDMHDIPLGFSDIYDYQYWIANDSLVLIKNDKSKGNFLDIANLNTGKRIGAFLPYGEGPDEILFDDIFFDGSQIVVTDFIRSRFAQFTPDKLMQYSFKPRFNNFPIELYATSPPLLYGNDSILLVNPFRYINKRYGIEQNEPRFIKIPIEYESLQYNTTGLYITNCVGQIILAENPVDKRLWAASYEKSVIEIYDTATNLEKTISIPSKVSQDPQVAVVESRGVKEVVAQGQRSSAFQSMTFDKKDGSAYLLLVGEIFLKGQKSNEKGAHIIHLDREGNFINGAYSPQYIRNISVSNGTIYATILDEDENPKLVKATLPDEK